MVINWDRRNYTKQEFTKAWNDSFCLSDVVRTLLPESLLENGKVSGGNIKSMSRTAISLGLTREHFDTKVIYARRVGISDSRLPLEKILIKNSDYNNTNGLKNRLLKEGIKKAECENTRCYVREDCRHLVPITLDHINGINNDHRIENLRILCYNCHGLTDTYGARNRKRSSNPTGEFLDYHHIKTYEQIVNIQRLKEQSIRDEKQRNKDAKPIPRARPTKIQYPPVEDIISGIEKVGYSAYAKTLGVSDNAVKKISQKA